MKRGMKRKLRKCLFRVLSMAMAICMALSMLPQTALASMADLMGNSREENEGILDELARLAGGDYEAARELLESLGLLDENGDLITDRSICLDGEELSLDEVTAILEDENTDLSRIADVDGTPIALGDLKTMIAIEKELIRLKETYFSDRVFEGEAVDNLNDLLEQLQGEGITMHVDPEPQADNATGTEEELNRAAGSGSNGNGVHAVNMNGAKSVSINTSGQAESGEFDLQKGETVSMDLEYVNGLLGEYIASVKVEIGADASNPLKSTTLTPGQPSGTLSYTNNAASDLSGLKLFISVSTDETKIGTVNKFSFRDVTAVLKITNASGLAFYKDGSYRDSHNVMLCADLNSLKPVATGKSVTTTSTVSGTDGNLKFSIGVKEDGSLDGSFRDFNGLIDALQDMKTADMSEEEKTTNALRYDVDMSIKLTCDAPTVSNPTARNIRFYAKPNRSSDFKFNEFSNIAGGSGNSKVDYRRIVSIPNSGSGTQYKYEASCLEPEDGLYIPPYMTVVSAWWDVASGLPQSKDYTVTVRSTASIVSGSGVHPSVTFSIPQGSYASGSLIPITMRFDTFVKVTENASIMINGVSCSASDLSIENAFGDKMIAWYPVKDADGTGLTITSMTGFTDIFDHGINGGDELSYIAPGVTLDTVRLKDCLTAFELTCEEVGENNSGNGVSCEVGYEIALRQEEAYRTVYNNYISAADNTKNYAPFKVEIEEGSIIRKLRPVFAEDPNDPNRKNLILQMEEGDKIGISFKKDPQEVTAKLFINSGTETSPVWEEAPYYYSVRKYEIRERKNVTSIKVKPETGEHSDQVITLGEGWMPTLSVTVSPSDADCITGKWSSNNEEIAVIDPDTGTVSVTNTRLGEVAFTFTAENGTTEETDDVIGTSLPYRVIAGTGYSLVVPNGASTILALTGTNATVHWSSNVGVKSPDTYDFKYKVELFKGNYADEKALETAFNSDNTILVETFEAKKDSSKQEIDGKYLTEISDSKNTPVYTVRISTPNPTALNDRTADLVAIAHIVMLSKPGVAKLVRPENIYLTDDVKSVSVKWKVEEGTGSTGKATLRVTNDSMPVKGLEGDADQDGVVELTGTEGVCSFAIEKVDLESGNPKDIYQIVLSVDNTGTWSEVPSVDSYPLYVYGKDALKIAGSDGEEISSIALDNHGKVSGKLPTDTESILKLREELGLIDYIGVNYEKYQWSSFYDGIKWAIDKDEISLNYKQGGLYENIKKFSYETYLPETKFALSSTADATATVTATHAATGMSTSLQVSSKTLKDQFFLFQITPALKTELCYTNGAGERRSVFTNEEGVLALYEPEGIASDLELSSQSGKSVYMGTMLKETLRSGERDATLLQLYPLNTFKLRLAARAEVTLTKPDGTPFKNETVTLRGGVFKNGFYCQDAKLGSTKDADSLKDGKTDASYTTDGNGKLTVYMDSMQFYSTENGESKEKAEVTPKDRLEYILEIRDIAKDKYFPLFLTINGQMGVDEVMRSGAGIVSLEEAPAGGARPHLAAQNVSHPLDGDDSELDVKGFTGRIGPNSSFPTAVLHSVVLLWGIEGSDSAEFKLEVADQNGYVPESAQKSLVKKYPFSYIPLVENYLTLSEETMSGSGWVEEKKDMGLKTRLYKDGNLIQEQLLPFRIVDMTKLPKVTEDDKIKSTVIGIAGASIVQYDGVEFGDADSNILNLLTGQLGELQGPIDQTTFKLLITPSEDASVFKAMIWAGYDSLGLDDADYVDGVALGSTAMAQSLEIGVPGVGDLTGMAKGEYDPKKEAKETKANGKDGDMELKLQLEGYYEAEIRYNFEEDKWEIFTTGGGFTAGIGLSWTFSVNTFAGPVPVTGTFEVGGAVQLSFKTAVRYGQQGKGLEWADPEEKCVNDFLTSLRFNGYVHAFGGVGFDYSVVALKVGLFGNIDINNENRFLSRTYLKDDYKRQLNGQAFNITGEVGIKFVAQFLFIQYECVLLSGKAGYTETWNDFHEIGQYWDEATSGLSSESVNKMANDGNFEVVSASATLQSREYLEEYARTWASSGQRQALPQGLAMLQENANPGSYPVVSANGKTLAFISDNESSSIYDSRVYYSYLDNGSYSKPVAIRDPEGFAGYGDSSLSVAGTSLYSVAAWVRSSEAIPGKDSGDSMSPEEQNLMMNGTEIVASLGLHGELTATKRLTENATPDIAPVAVVNGNDYYDQISPIKAYVFWRSTYSASEFGEDDLLGFATRDCIMYSYAENKNYTWSDWSEPKMLYNGMSGSVKALSAAVSPYGGIPIAVYTLDQGGKNDPKDYEIAYSIPYDAIGNIESMIITSDHNADENPQVIGISEKEDDYFIIGWSSEKDGNRDIRLQKIHALSGGMEDDFPESISQLTADGSNPVNGNFVFAGQNNTCYPNSTEDYKDITNLTFVWSETLAEDPVEGVVTVGHDIIKAAKLGANEDGTYRISAPVTVAELEERTQADSFCAYVSSENEVKAVIQATQYDTANEERKMYAYNEETKKKEEVTISLPKEKTNIYTATSHFEVNAASIENICVDYATVSADSLTPVQFEIKNTGINDLDGLKVTLADGEEATLNKKLIPNESTTLTVWHKTGSSLTDVDYSVTANSGAINETGTVYLDYPDLGIAGMEVIEENAGKRKILMTLYNAGDATLSGKKNREVKLDFYTDDLYKDKAEITCSMDGVAVAGNEITISGEEALGRIDDGTYTIELTYDLGKYVSTELKRDEIPESGIYLYVDAWTKGMIKNESRCLPEYRTSDNKKVVLLDSPLARTGKVIQIEVEQGLDDEENTTAEVTVKNNSLKEKKTAVMAALLLDEEDNVQEIKPLSLSTSLAGESANTELIKFSKQGNRVSVIAAEGGKDLLNFEGLPVEMSDFVKDGENQYSYTLYGVIAKSTVVTAINGTGGKVTINGEESEGIGSVKVDIPLNESKITVSIGDKTYTLNLSTKKREYTILLDPNGGVLSDVTSMKRTNDDLYGPLPVPEWEGYVFEGWYTEAAGGDLISDDTKVALSENITIYAHWKEDVSGLTIAFAEPGKTYTYTGSPIRPEIVVKNNGIRLSEGVDYTVSYSNNVNASLTSGNKKKARITVKGKGNLADSVYQEFVIQPKNLNDITVREIVVASNAKASPGLYYAGKKLKSKDYTITEAPKNQKYTQDGTMKVEGKGNFTGEIHIQVTVVDKKDLKKIKVTPGNEVLTYDGKEKKISFTVEDAKTGEALKDTDYFVLYPDNITDAGKKKFMVIGLGNYTNEITKEYTIKPYVVPEEDIRMEGIDPAGYEFIPSGVSFGKDLKISFVKDGVAFDLTEGTDYKVTYKNNKKVGDKAKCSVTFLNNFKGTKKQEKEFKINPQVLNANTKGLNIIVADQRYSGKAGTYVSKPYVLLNGTSIKPSCYTVTYYKDAAMTDEIKGKNTITLGEEEKSATVYVKITGKGNYASDKAEDSIRASYQVRNEKDLVDLSKAKTKITLLDPEGNAVKNNRLMYTGKALKPPVKVEIKSAGSREYVTLDPANYDVAYMDNTGKGNATIVIKGKGAGYTGSKKVAFKIAAKTLLNLKFLGF